MNDTTQTTMRQLLARWAEVEPDKIENEQWDDTVSGNTCEEFRISGVAVLSDFIKVGESSLALIQWGIQQAIVERGWGLELDYYPGNDGWRATIKPGPRWTTGGSNNVAEALLSAYLAALEASK